MQKATIEWHPVKCVPFDPERHADLFEEGQEPEFVWEGSMPEHDGNFLVTCKGEGSRRYVEVQEYDCDDPGFYDEYVIAWAELPEPYKEEQTNENN